MPAATRFRTIRPDAVFTAGLAVAICAASCVPLVGQPVAPSSAKPVESPAAGTETPAEPIELELFKIAPLAWLTEQNVLPAGKRYEANVPNTLDLAEIARDAVHGLTEFLDDRHHYSGFGHGVFSTQPPCFIHDGGQDQNWGKVLEALALARAMSGSRENSARQRASTEAMFSYAELKSLEPYPVPLARILMAAEALHRYCPQEELPPLIAQQRASLTTKIQIDAALQQGFFGPVADRWRRDDKDSLLGVLGHSLNVFTGGSVLRALVRADALAGKSDPQFPILLRNGLMDARFWDAPQAAALALPASSGSTHGRFAGHHHSHTAALLGLLYYGHTFHDAEAIEFVRKAYENLRTFGIARIGLFGESCTAGDMTYLAVRMSQWNVGDYWEDVDQYVRNQLTETQIRDTIGLDAVVRAQARPLVPAELGDWAKGLDTRDAVRRSRGLFWSDATHPTLIPIRDDTGPAATCLQWVVCCSGNCTKALHEVWAGMVDEDPASRLVRIHLLLNRASPRVDIDSYLPHEGRVVVRVKEPCQLAIRLPRWADHRAVRFTQELPAAGRTADATLRERQPIPESRVTWLGTYALIPEQPAGSVVTLEFPMRESIETVDLNWRLDQFWLESTQPPASWREAPPTRFTLTLRGNTLIDIQPRDSRPGYPLYAARSPESARRPAVMRNVTRFLPTHR